MKSLKLSKYLQKYTFVSGERGSVKTSDDGGRRRDAARVHNRAFHAPAPFGAPRLPH